MLKRGFKGFFAEVDMVVAFASVPDQSHRFEQTDPFFPVLADPKNAIMGTKLQTSSMCP